MEDIPDGEIPVDGDGGLPVRQGKGILIRQIEIVGSSVWFPAEDFVGLRKGPDPGRVVVAKQDPVLGLCDVFPFVGKSSLAVVIGAAVESIENKGD
ncbi:MAG: hypothetical protein WCR16_03025 [Bacilli bacterium]